MVYKNELPEPQDQISAKLKLDFYQSGRSSFALDVNISLPSQGVTAIFGESGSGKTTLLRCIAGLEKSVKGQLTVNGETWQSTEGFLSTHNRALGYVFQEASLFEHLTAQANLDYAIKRSHQTPSIALYSQVLHVMGIEALLHQYPQQLSGGERQRVAIARALLSQPKILLMDEPLASLDASRKLDILPYLERLRVNFKIPILYVTHSVDEMVRLADHLLVLRSGKVIEQGPVTELFSRTDLPLGTNNEVGAIIECRILEIDQQWQLMRVSFAEQYLWLPYAGQDVNHTHRIRILASDVSIALSRPSDSSILNVLRGRIVDIVQDNLPSMCLVKLNVGSHYILAKITRKSIQTLDLALDCDVWLQVKTAAIIR